MESLPGFAPTEFKKLSGFLRLQPISIPLTTRALKYPVQCMHAETKGLGKHRSGIESGTSAPGKQPPPCGRGSRRTG